jgi:hypothetical protein
LDPGEERNRNKYVWGPKTISERKFNRRLGIAAMYNGKRLSMPENEREKEKERERKKEIRFNERNICRYMKEKDKCIRKGGLQ